MSGSFAPPSSGSSGVSSFNTRTGAVVPTTGDYTAAQVGAADASHASASANVHGLPASVNALGDRSASGRYVQSGSVNTNATGIAAGIGGSGGYSNTRQTTVTFPSAFSTAPRVLVSGAWSYSVDTITASNFIVYQYDNLGTGSQAIQCNWLAIGS